MTEPDQELILHDGRKLPAATDLRRTLRAGLDAAIAEEETALAAKGDPLPEDYYHAFRRYGAIAETAADYGRAFADFARDVRKSAVLETLATAVGEQDGVPNQGITVPDIDGTDLKIEIDAANSYSFDESALRNATAFQFMTDRHEQLVKMFQSEFHGDGEEAVRLLSELLADAMAVYTSLGKFVPQVSKVRAAAATVARMEGGETVAAALKQATTKKTDFKGVKVTREQPKAKP
jgi:hypothetical protein